MESFRLLEDRVIGAGGLLHVSMEDLRNAAGAGKLGTHVRNTIERQLAVQELHLLEPRLPNDQRAMVWLVSPKTTWGAMLLDVIDELRSGERSAGMIADPRRPLISSHARAWCTAMGVDQAEVAVTLTEPVLTYPSPHRYGIGRRISVRGRLAVVHTERWVVITVLWNGRTGREQGPPIAA